MNIKKIVTLALTFLFLGITINVDAATTSDMSMTVRVKQVGIEINVTSYDFGFLQFDTESETDITLFRVNNTGNYMEDIYTSASMPNWTLGTTASTDQMILYLKTSGGNFSAWEPIANGDNDKMANDVLSGHNFTFGIKIHSPTSATIFDKQWITINVSAVLN